MKITPIIESALYSKEAYEEQIAEWVKTYWLESGALLLEGPLGSGKSTFVQNFCKIIGVKEITTSPTYAYVNSYKTAAGKSVVHFDLYRLSDINEFFANGFDELALSADYVLIEWPGIIDQWVHDSGKPWFKIVLKYAELSTIRNVSLYRLE